jgi:hypothetical protein
MTPNTRRLRAHFSYALLGYVQRLTHSTRDIVGAGIDDDVEARPHQHDSCAQRGGVPLGLWLHEDVAANQGASKTAQLYRPTARGSQGSIRTNLWSK